MLELKDASLTLGGRELFRKLSLMALDGQITCITGKPGTGKTATLQAMLGFLLLDEGLVSIDGELLTPQSAPTFRKLMAYVPQKEEVAISPVDVDTHGLEAVWAPAPMASKPIIIADDPDPSLLGVLRSMADGGHTVIIASRREEFINLSDKIITLGTS